MNRPAASREILIIALDFETLREADALVAATVSRACAQGAKLGAGFLTVHAYPRRCRPRKMALRAHPSGAAMTRSFYAPQSKER